MRQFIMIFCLFMFLACATQRSPNSAKIFAQSEQAKANLPHRKVYFGFDSFKLNNGEMCKIAADAAWLQKNSSSVVLLSGHADSAGPAEYNLELGDRRARQVAASLMSQGVSPEQIAAVVSYGEGRPISKVAAKNRRVEISAE